MDEVSTYREENQPTKERTGGSTFKNPDGLSAWKLVDEAGFRGFELGGAQVSPKHTNFLINTGDATAEDIERLGEMVRGKVREQTGLELHWEIKRIGRHSDGVSIPEFLEGAEA
jgi:UDP-N-acetylmuramate dehydrogenase